MAQLSEKDIASIKRALEKFATTVRDAMRVALAESRREDAGAAAAVHDLGDESLADELTAVNSALAERHGQELLLVERAQQRIVDLEIGVCTDCACDIGVERLLANPIATRCIACETRHEHTHAHAAMPRL